MKWLIIKKCPIVTLMVEWQNFCPNFDVIVQLLGVMWFWCQLLSYHDDANFQKYTIQNKIFIWLKNSKYSFELNGTIYSRLWLQIFLFVNISHQWGGWCGGPSGQPPTIQCVLFDSVTHIESQCHHHCTTTSLHHSN